MANGFTKSVFRAVQNISTMALGHKGVNLIPATMTIGGMLGANSYPELATGAHIATYLISGITIGGVVGALGNLSLKKVETNDEIDPRTESDWQHYKAELLHETSRDIGKRKPVSRR